MIARLERPLADSGAWLRRGATLAWLGAVVLIAVTLAFYVRREAPAQPTALVQGPLGVAAIALTGLLYASVGAFLLRRASGDAIGWALLGIGVGMAVILPLDQLVEASIHSFRSIPAATVLVAWALSSVHLPASGAAAVLVMLLFPTRGLDWRYAGWTLTLAIGGTALLGISTALRPEGLLWYPTLPNPLGLPIGVAPVVSAASILGVSAFVASLALAVAGLAWRARHGDRRLRRRLVWVALGSVAMAGSVAFLFIGRYAGFVSGGAESEVLAFGAALGAALLPLAMARFATVTASQGQEARDRTFLFTDLLDSTAMYANVGDLVAFDLVRLHFDTLTAAARRHRGEVIKTIGDALMACFEDPADAVRAALEMFDGLDRFNRRNASDLVLKVGIHRGPAIVGRGRTRTDYFGQTVNVASRVGAIAAPGELVLTEAVAGGDGVMPLLAGYDAPSEQATLKGVAGEVLVHRLRPARSPAAVSG
jgi:class 3 adenylate cyclase